MRELSNEEQAAVERAAAEPMLAQVQAWKVGDSISIAAAPPAFGRPRKVGDSISIAAAPPAFGRPIYILSPDICIRMCSRPSGTGCDGIAGISLVGCKVSRRGAETQRGRASRTRSLTRYMLEEALRGTIGTITPPRLCVSARHLGLRGPLCLFGPRSRLSPG